MQKEKHTNTKSAGGDPMVRYRVGAVAHATDVLYQFMRGTPVLHADRIATAVGLSPALTRRTLYTLKCHGLVQEVPDSPGAYELGLSWLRLADVLRRQFDIRRLALPIMRRMRDTVDETVILSIRAGNKRVNIDYVESMQAIRRVTQPGFEAPLHIGATGRIFLASFDSQQVAEYLKTVPLVGHATGTPLSEAKLKQSLDEIRQLGYAVAFGEITSDTAAVAAPVRDYRGAIVAVLTISCPRDRFTATLKNACATAVLEGAKDLARCLGHDPKRAA